MKNIIYFLKSLGGSNNKSNLVKLTAREHFIAHLLLVKIYTKGTKEYGKMTYALNRMKSSHKHYQICARQYESIRKLHAATLRKTKGSYKWITNGIENKFVKNVPTALPKGWRYGKIFSKEHAEKLDNFRRSRDASSAIAAMQKSSLGKIVSQETRERMSQARKGKTASKETRRKMAVAQKNRFTKL